MKKKKQHIGQHIKRLRSFRGMNQEQLAKAIGKTRSLISHMERTGVVNDYTLKDIAAVLNVDVEEIEKGIIPAELLSTQDPEAVVIKQDPCKETISKQKEEISFLKDTINHQWQLLHELARKKG